MGQRESFRVGSDGHKIVFRRPLTTRLFGAVAGILFPGYLPLRLAVGYGNPQHMEPMTMISWLLFVIAEGGCLSIGAGFLSLAGPEDLCLDLDRHTYRFVFGWPFLSQVREGPWEDIAGVYVCQLRPGDAYRVGIAWRGDAMRLPVLGVRPTWVGVFNGLGRWPRADQFAAETAAVLGVPLVAPPFRTAVAR